jgi:hypothetical protein
VESWTDGAHWWSGRAGCFPIGDEHVAKEKKHFFKGHTVRRGDEERSFGDHVNQERILSVYVDRKGGDSLTTRFEEEVMENGPFQGQVMGEEVIKEILGMWMGKMI